MNELQIFNYSDKSVRTLLKNGEPWWVLKDVVDILGIQNHKDVAARLDPDEKGVDLIDTPGGPQQMTIINEPGLYNVILRSDKPEAKAFKRWITHEVIPTIRKHGMYATEELLNNPDLLIQVATELKKAREEKKLLEAENKLLAGQALTWSNRKILEAIVKKYGAWLDKHTDPSINGFQEAWREFKKELLYAHGISLNERITANMKSKKTAPKTLDMIHDDELPDCISTAVALCNRNNVDISDILKKVA